MTEPILDHDRLDVDRLAIEYTAESLGAAKGLSGLHRHDRDQWLQASYGLEGDHEHRFAEHEHESPTEPEPTEGPERQIGSSGMVR